ncbi:MAG TPA: hypothetical protein VEV43_11200, partial [Actinomycetota bacterium]|nr:hypothetical protein [Actinomycetota bacterium]
AQIAIGTVEGREAVVLAGDWGCAVHDASTGDLILSDAVPTLALTNAASGVMLLRHAPVGYAVVPLGRTSSTEYRLPDPSELPDLPLMALGEGESSLLLAVVSRLGSGSVWNLRTGRRVGDVQFDIEVRAIAVSAVDRRTLVVAINDTDQEGGFVMSREATPVSLRRAAVARRPVRGVVGVGLVGEALVALERSGDTLELRSVPDGRPLPYDDEAVRVVAGESVEHQTAALPRVSRMGLGEVRVERPEEWPPTASAVGDLGGRKVIVRGSYGGVVVVFDATTGELVAAVQTELPQTVHLGTKGGPSAVSDVAVGSDLIAAAYEGSVLLFDVGLERLPSDWIDAVAVRAVAVGAIDARMAVVATGGDGGGLRLWDVATRTRVASITLDVAVRRVWLCGGVVVASTADGMLHAFDVRDRDARRAQPRD